MPEAIEIEGLQKHYEDVIAVDVPRLSVAPASALVLVGPSGCGKSTLLRIITGLVSPDRGRVAVGGTRMSPETRRALLLRIGYVIQEGGLFPHLTALENVTLVAVDQRWPADRVTARLRELQELTRLAPALLARYPVQLSGGERQRVALMRALFLDPEVLLLDEPLAALDPIVRFELQRELRRIFSTLGKGVLFVTHDIAEAAYVGDEIAIMRAGRIVQRGSFEELNEHPSDPFVSEFIQAQRHR